MSRFIWASALMVTLLVSGAALAQPAQPNPGPCVDCLFHNLTTNNYDVFVRVPEEISEPIFEVTATTQNCTSTVAVDVSNNPYAFFIQNVQVDCLGKSSVDEVIFTYGDVDVPEHIHVRLGPQSEATVLDFIDAGLIYLFLDTPVPSLTPPTTKMNSGGGDLRLITDKPRP